MKCADQGILDVTAQAAVVAMVILMALALLAGTDKEAALRSALSQADQPATVFSVATVEENANTRR